MRRGLFASPYLTIFIVKNTITLVTMFSHIRYRFRCRVRTVLVFTHQRIPLSRCTHQRCSAYVSFAYTEVLIGHRPPAFECFPSVVEICGVTTHQFTPTHICPYVFIVISTTPLPAPLGCWDGTRHC